MIGMDKRRKPHRLGQGFLEVSLHPLSGTADAYGTSLLHGCDIAFHLSACLHLGFCHQDEAQSGEEVIGSDVSSSPDTL